MQRWCCRDRASASLPPGVCSSQSKLVLVLWVNGLFPSHRLLHGSHSCLGYSVRARHNW